VDTVGVNKKQFTKSAAFHITRVKFASLLDGDQILCSLT